MLKNEDILKLLDSHESPTDLLTTFSVARLGRWRRQDLQAFSRWKTVILNG